MKDFPSRYEVSINIITSISPIESESILVDHLVLIMVQTQVDKLNAILGAANVKVQPFWPSLFARVLANRNIDDFILNAGGGGG